MSKIDINVEQVFGALNSVKFDIGGNPYGVMTSISAYISSIYNAVASLEEGWNSSYNSVAEYVESFYGVPVPDRDPEPESDFLNNGSLQNVSEGASDDSSASSQNSADSSESSNGSSSSGGSSGGGSTPGGSKTPNNDSSKKKNGSAVALANSDLQIKDKDGNVIGNLEQGSKFTILDDNGKNSLVKIQLEDGSIAYVDRSGLNIVSKSSTIARVKLSHSNNRLNVRSTPNSTDNSNIVTTLKNDASVEVVGTSENGWTKIKLNGNVGYVVSEYLEI